MKIEKYIAEHKLDGTKLADVLRDYERGLKPLGEICWFHGYDIDLAVGHLSQAGLIVLN
jgi:hypothetical protein